MLACYGCLYSNLLSAVAKGHNIIHTKSFFILRLKGIENFKKTELRYTVYKHSDFSAMQKAGCKHATRMYRLNTTTMVTVTEQPFCKHQAVALIYRMAQKKNKTSDILQMVCPLNKTKRMMANLVFLFSKCIAQLRKLIFYASECALHSLTIF